VLKNNKSSLQFKKNTKKQLLKTESRHNKTVPEQENLKTKYHNRKPKNHQEQWTNINQT
jgi:hypothetical protein